MVALIIFLIIEIYCNGSSRWDGDSKKICNLFTSANQRTNKYSQKSKFGIRWELAQNINFFTFQNTTALENTCTYTHTHTLRPQREKTLYFLNAYITLTWRWRGFFLVETIEKKQHIDTLTGTAVQYNSIYFNHPTIFCSLQGFKLFSTSYL